MASVDTRRNLGFRYVISPKNTTVQTEASDFPKLWFQRNTTEDLTESGDTVVPYLVLPLEPSPGMHSLFGLEFTERRFITSSGILDAITGSKPVSNLIYLLCLPRNPHRLRHADVRKSSCIIPME